MSGRASNLATVDAAVGDVAPLPRDNGELVFEEPWQGRRSAWPSSRSTGSACRGPTSGATASAITVRPASQDESPATAYYTAWLDALETLLAPFSAL